jgi:hypothetical protein
MSSEIIAQIQRDLEAKVKSVLTEQSDDLKAIKSALEKTKERKRATADKLRKFQIRNVHAHYDFDMRDLEVQYKNACQSAKEKLVAEYRRTAAKAIEDEEERVKKEVREREEAEKKAKEELEKAKIAAAAALAGEGGALKNNENDNKGSEEEEGYVIGQRATRTSGVSEFIELKDTGATSAVQNQLDIEREKERSANERKRKLEQVTNQKLEFVKVIPHADMKSDFAQIVGGMEKRNRQVLRTQPRNLGHSFQLVQDSFFCHLRINGRDIYTGDLVVVFSSLSRESFCGVITSVDEAEIAVRCGNGTTFGFSAEQVRTGRITVARDDEGIAAADAIKAASKLLQV